MQNACTLNKLNLLRNTVTLLHAISLYAVVRLHITCFHFRQPLRNITQPPPPPVRETFRRIIPVLDAEKVVDPWINRPERDSPRDYIGTASIKRNPVSCFLEESSSREQTPLDPAVSPWRVTTLWIILLSWKMEISLLRRVEDSLYIIKVQLQYWRRSRWLLRSVLPSCCLRQTKTNLIDSGRTCPASCEFT